MRRIFLLAALQPTLSFAYGQNFKPGDKVEIYNSGGWYKGSILEIGTGTMQGYYSVSYDGYNQPQWMKASNIKLQTATKVISTAGGPRKGWYLILSYGNINNPLRLGYFQLSGGQYSYYDMAKNLLGKGSYSYDAATKNVTWGSGPFKEAAYTGTFEIDREGKTHKIRLNSVTIGSNSTESD